MKSFRLLFRVEWTVIMRYIYKNFLLEKKILDKSFSAGFFKLNIKSWSIVFFGSDNYSLLSLKVLNEEMKHKFSNFEIVVTNEKNPVYKYAISNNFKIHFWPPTLNALFDFGVIVSFGKLIPKNIIEHFSLGIINVHGSLLPKYRGGMPIVHAIKNGDTLTGVTVTKIRPDKFDTGEIILQKPCVIDKNELMPSLFGRLSQLGCECLVEVINSMPKCLENSIPQPGESISYAPKLTKEAAVVKWNDMTALEVFNLYRALFGIFELQSMWQNQSVKFLCISLSNIDSLYLVQEKGLKSEPGSFLYDKKSKFLYVQCKDSPVAVCTVKFNKKMHKASAFYSGYVNKVSRHLWKFET